MAVDTRDKRFSLFGFANPFRLVMPNPDGTVNGYDRAQWVYLYSGAGIDIGGGPVGGGTTVLQPMRLLGPI